MKTVKAVHVNSRDTCVTLTGFADEGDTVGYVENGVEKSITARESIPKWHKMAVVPVEKGLNIYKYGAAIGIALERIEAGDCVHIHNMRSLGDGG